jgi:hypothetical protein
MTKLGTYLVGLGLWLAQRPRQPLHAVPPFALVGRGAIAKLNDVYQQAELARRHAKPSTRKRVV